MPPMKQPTSITDLYGGEVHLEFYEQYGRRKHVYRIGEFDVPSVTKILDVLDKPALVAWAVNEMEIALLRDLTPGTVIDEINFPQQLAAAKNARYQKSDAGKSIGALAHDWIEQWVKAAIEQRELGSLELSYKWPEKPINPQLLAAVEAFLAWQEQHDIKWLRSEQKVYSRTYDYCGTFDFVALVDGQLTLGDFKTTNANKSTGSGIYPEYWLQTAAYQFAWQEEQAHGWEADGRIAASNPPRIDQRMIVRLGKEANADAGVDFEVKVSREFERDLAGFLGALAAYRALAPIADGDGIATVGLDTELLQLAKGKVAA